MSEDDQPSRPVGYKSPPAATRFKPGQSGNRRGRPRTVPSVRQMIEQELLTKFVIQENGERKKVSKLTSSIKHGVNAAAKGDAKGIRLLRDLVQACEILQLGQQSSTRSDPLEGLDLSKMSVEELICLYQTIAKQP
jgi:hypothetical protein